MDQFLNNNCDSKATRANYSSGLKHYFKTLNIEPDNYFKSKRNYEEDIMTYWKELQNYAPLTRTARISIIKLFFEEFDINISNKTKKKLKRKLKGNKPITLDTIPTNQQLKQILSHGETKARALGLLASSSGMRIEEILGLTEEDIDFNHDPVKIYVRSEIAKFGLARICFCSNEASEAIKEWLKEREQYLNTAAARCCGFKNPDDDTIFCFNQVTANKIWRRLLRDSGFNQKDKTTGVHRYHFHVLRKYYETRMSYAGVPEAIYQQLEGHTGYLNGSYKRYTDQELGEAYKKGVKSLLIYETSPDLTEHDERISQLEKENEELNKKLDKVMRSALINKFLAEENQDKP